MSGSVYPYTLSNGRRKWGFQVTLGKPYWDAEKGCRVRPQVRKEGFDRKLDAQEALEEVVHQVKVGIAPRLADRRLTVAEWADRWLASKASIRPSTLQCYAQTINTYVKPSIGDLPLMALRADHLDEMLALMRSGQLRPKLNRRGKEGKLAAITIRQHFTVVSVMLGAAAKRRLIPYSPTAGVELEKPERRDKPAWSVQEAETFLALAEREEPRLAIGFRVALSYGLRRGEAAALRWEDLDTGEGWLHVRQNLPAVGGLKFGPPKTDAGRRSIPLEIDPGFAAALREHRKRQLADRMAAGPDWTDTGLVLAGEHGELIHPGRLTPGFGALVEQAGLPVITLHGCRRTANSTWAAAGVDLALCNSWGGWFDKSMADGTYLQIRPEVHKAGAKLVAAYRAVNSLSSKAL
jgi:integrase